MPPFEHKSLERLVFSRDWFGRTAQPNMLLRGHYPALEHITIEGLWISAFSGEQPLFSRCPKLTKLDILDGSFWGTIESTGDSPLGMLLEEEVFRRLTHLTIRSSMNDPSAIGILLESGQLENLKRLDLQDNALRAEGAKALLAHEGLEHLEHLDLLHCDIPEQLRPALKEKFPKATLLF